MCEHCADRFDVRDGIACFLREITDYTENYDQISLDDLVEPKTPPVVKEAYAQLVRWRARGVSCDLGCGDGYVIQRVDGGIFKKCVNSQAVYPLSEQHGLEAQERR